MVAIVLSKIGELGMVGIILLAISLLFGIISFLILRNQEKKLVQEMEEMYF